MNYTTPASGANIGSSDLAIFLDMPLSCPVTMSNPASEELGLIESLSKFFAVALGILYLSGFLVVAFHLSRYGVSGFSVLQLQYLIAGAWALGPPVVYVLIINLSHRFEERAAPPVEGRFSWRRVVVSSLLSGIPSGLFIAVLVAIPHLLESLTWGIGIRLILFCFAIQISALVSWMSWRAADDTETRWINRSHAAPFYLTLLATIVLVYCLWFSKRIYPLIPFSFGGGRPLKVAFIEGEKKLPNEIEKPDRSAKRSIPYKLLLATDRYYVVLSPYPNEGSMEISRDSVAGMVVLE